MGNTSSRKPLQTPPSVEAVPEQLPEPSTLTCEICIEPMLSTQKFRNNGLCVHPFCIDCVTKFIQVKVEDDHAADVRCPGLNCGHLLDPLSCRPLVSPQLFDKWCDALCDKAMLGFERCYCPNRNCSALVVNECGGNLKQSVCPNCKRPFCFNCQLPWHAGYRCEESGEMRDSNDIAFGVLVERKNWMRCPKCKHCVERIEGCSRVKCRCGTFFCYKCGKKLKKLACDCNRNRSCFICIWCFRAFFVTLLLLQLIVLVARHWVWYHGIGFSVILPILFCVFCCC